MEEYFEYKYGEYPAPVVDAVYTEARFKCDLGNIFIEALPKMMPRDKILAHYYRGMDIVPSLSGEIDEQLEEVSFLRNVRFPLAFIIEMERTLYREIIESYRYRYSDIRQVEMGITTENQPDKQAFGFVDNIGGDGDTGLSLLGESGCGKSTAVQQMLSHYPRVIVHKVNGGTFKQIVWIRAVMSANSDLHSLYSSLADSIDQTLGNMDSYYGKIVRKMQRISEKASFIAKLVKVFAIGVIVIDEIQNMNSSTHRDSSYNSILNITNTTKVVLFTIGTEDAYPLFLRNHYIARRSGTPIRASEYCRNKEFCFKMERWLMGVNWFLDSFSVTREILEEFYKVSLGYVGRMISIWMEVQFIYIKARQKPEITPELIRKAAEIVYTKESTVLALEASHNNLLFPVDSGSSREIVTNEGKSAIAEMQFRLETGNITVADFKDFTAPSMVFDVYVKSIQAVKVRGLPYNWESVKKSVVHVCKLKSSKSKNQEELVAVVLQYLEKKNSDRIGRKSPAKKKLVNIDSLENIFSQKK